MSMWESQYFAATAIHAGADFVEYFAQAEDVGLRRARAFRRKVAFCAHNRMCVARLGHQSDVAELGHAVHQNHVGRFDVAVDEAVLVQVRQGRRQRETDLHAVRDGEAGVLFEIGAEGARHVCGR